MNENIVVIQQLPKALQEAVDSYKNQGIIIHEPRGDHGKWIASANSFSICPAGTLEDLLEELAGHEMVSVMTYEQAIAEAGRPFAEAILKFADWKKPEPGRRKPHVDPDPLGYRRS